MVGIDARTPDGGRIEVVFTAVHKFRPFRGLRWFLLWTTYLWRNRTRLIPAEQWARWAVELGFVHPAERSRTEQVYNAVKLLLGPPK